MTAENKLKIIIDSSAKEDFKKMMGWTEEEFQKNVKRYEDNFRNSYTR